jgi:glycosyltransferase involved in cell wall biosynthesis
VIFLHHVHAEMWQMTLRPWHARAGAFVERRVAPPLYRGTRLVTLSESSRREIVSMLGLPGSRVTVVPPGIDDLFAPGGTRAPRPLVVAVGRLVPVKRFDLLIDALALVRRSVPDLRAVIVGEGYERARLEAHRRSVGAEGWLELPGFKEDKELLDLYRSAWVLASTSQREGWGMTISEAGACATPAVVSRIAGHVDAVEDQVSGLVAEVGSRADGRGVRGGERRPSSEFARSLRAVLTDRALRARLGHGARARADQLSWDTTASGTLDALVDEAVARKRPPG